MSNLKRQSRELLLYAANSNALALYDNATDTIRQALKELPKETPEEIKAAANLRRLLKLMANEYREPLRVSLIISREELVRASND